MTANAIFPRESDSTKGTVINDDLLSVILHRIFTLTERHEDTPSRRQIEMVLLGMESMPEIAPASAAVLAKSREDPFKEAASVDARVIDMLIATGKVRREDVDVALAMVAKATVQEEAPGTPTQPTVRH
ncbi:hypothetical protein [Cupriavidus basilensis]|uniref:hypothetical protein n=1 Tax=Cupriavidus basilensis TaxID=68895 RepID=UPI0007515D34|nr:hypothetical protein [Cupriavidus basilensis]